MTESLIALKAWTIALTHHYGYHAVAPVLLADPAGVPWAWIFLMLLAGEASLNVPVMLLYGFAVLSVADYALYWLGAWGGRPLVRRIGHRWPKVSEAMEKSETLLRGKGIWAIVFGRYLPFAGRWVGVGAGLANVPFWRFALYDALGVMLTVVGFGTGAHLAGREIVDSPQFHTIVGASYLATTVLSALLCAWLTRRLRARSGSTAAL